MLGVYGTVYNSADTVRQTIEDLKSKLKEDFIIVVADNYSTDGTYEILKEYDFVDVIRMKCTRGMGRQKALEHLIRNYKEVDFIFYIDFDLTFPDYLDFVIKQIKKIYEDRSIYNPASALGEIASYDTYKEIIKKIRWPDMNLGEDYKRSFLLLKNNFHLFLLCFPMFYENMRKNREQKYVKKFSKTFYRAIIKGFLYEWMIMNMFYLFIKKFYFRNTTTYFFEKVSYVFPEDLGLDKELLLIYLYKYRKSSLPRSLKESLRKHGPPYYIIKRKYVNKFYNHIFIFRNAKKIEYYAKFYNLENKNLF